MFFKAIVNLYMNIFTYFNYFCKFIVIFVSQGTVIAIMELIDKAMRVTLNGIKTAVTISAAGGAKSTKAKINKN